MKGIYRHIIFAVVITTLSFFAVVYTSCKKETLPDTSACASIQCQNNGNCIEGKCYCIPGFEGDRCEKSSRTRYLGKWSVKEKIITSTKNSNINTTRSYTLTIREASDSKIGLLFDNFMGNAAYNNVEAVMNKKLNKQTLAYENDFATHFVIKFEQKIGGTNIIIADGEGTINDVGSIISGVYTIQYFDNGTLVNDTVSITADILP